MLSLALAYSALMRSHFGSSFVLRARFTGASLLLLRWSAAAPALRCPAVPVPAPTVVLATVAILVAPEPHVDDS